MWRRDIIKEQKLRNKYTEVSIMDAKTTGIIAYIGWIGWLIAYVAGDKDGAKYHLNQALVLNLFSLIAFLAPVWTVFMVLGIINAANDEEKPLPIIGTITLLN